MEETLFHRVEKQEREVVAAAHKVLVRLLRPGSNFDRFSPEELSALMELDWAMRDLINVLKL